MTERDHSPVETLLARLSPAMVNEYIADKKLRCGLCGNHTLRVIPDDTDRAPQVVMTARTPVQMVNHPASVFLSETDLMAPEVVIACGACSWITSLSAPVVAIEKVLKHDE